MPPIKVSGLSESLVSPDGSYLPIVIGGQTRKVNVNLLRENKDTINVLNNGVKGDGSTDDSANLSSLFANTNKTIIIPAGQYFIGSPISLTARSGMKILGAPGAVLTGPINNLLLIQGSLTDLQIGGLRFVSTKNSTTDDPLGLLTFSNYGSADIMDRVYVHNCYFTNPNTKANGMKILSEGSSSLIKGLSVRHNKFVDVGRFGFESQNHNVADGIKPRIKHFDISDNYFERVGTIQSGVAVCAISISGYQQNGEVNRNRIIDVKMDTTTQVYYGIENAGCTFMDIKDNKMFSENYGFTGILFSGGTAANALLAQDGSSIAGQPQVSHNLVKGNNIQLSGGSDGNKVRGIDAGQLINSVISGNSIVTDGYPLHLSNCERNKIFGNFLIGKAQKVAYLTSNGGSYCRQNDIYDNILDNTGANGQGGMIFFEGTNTQYNNAGQNSFFPHSDGDFFHAESTGAANNVCSNSGKYKTVGNGYTVDHLDDVVFLNYTSNDNVYLQNPIAFTGYAGKKVFIKNTTAFIITVVTGAPGSNENMIIGPYEGKLFCSDATGWRVLNQAGIPRLTTTQKNALTAFEGMEVYDLTLHKKSLYTGSAWETITSA